MCGRIRYLEIESFMNLLHPPNTISKRSISKTKEFRYLPPALTAATARRNRNKTVLFIIGSLGIRLAFDPQNALFIVIIRVFTGLW
jgi:hypothetical protein